MLVTALAEVGGMVGVTVNVGANVVDRAGDGACERLVDGDSIRKVSDSYARRAAGGVSVGR